MSTSGAYGFRVEGRDKLIYKHADSYVGGPHGLGARLLDEVPRLLEEYGFDQLRALALMMQGVPGTQQADPALAQAVQSIAPWCESLPDAADLPNLYAITCHLQGQLKPFLLLGTFPDASWCIRDSVLCEFAYIVNLDRGVFEAYIGRQMVKHNQGRYGHWDHSSGCWGCALVDRWPLRRLPTEDQLVEACLTQRAEVL